MQHIPQHNINQLPSGAATNGPRVCAVIPHRTEDPKGWIETRNRCHRCDEEVFVSAAAVEEMAKLIGWAPPEEVDALREHFEEQMEEQSRMLQELKDDAAKVIELDKARKLVAEHEAVVA